MKLNQETLCKQGSLKQCTNCTDCRVQRRITLSGVRFEQDMLGQWFWVSTCDHATVGRHQSPPFETLEACKVDAFQELVLP